MLQEVDIISDQVILIANGMIIEGQIRGVREEIHEHPSQFVIRCRDASRIASLLFEQDHITQIKLHEDRLMGASFWLRACCSGIRLSRRW